MSWPNAVNPQIRSFESKIFLDRLTLPVNSIYGEPAVRSLALSRKKALDFFSRLYTNLDTLPYIYFTAGVTEGLSISLRGRTVGVLTSEYRFVFALPGIEAASTHSPKVLLISSPHSGTGSHIDLYQDYYRACGSIIIDASYLMASNLMHNRVLPPNVETVLFGVSKSHDLAAQRFGVMFTKKRLSGYHEMQYEYGYASALVPQILDAIAASPANKLHLDNADKITALYKEKGLQIGDTLLFALDPVSKRRVPWYTLVN